MSLTGKIILVVIMSDIGLSAICQFDFTMPSIEPMKQGVIYTTREEVKKYVLQYEHLRDVQFANYELYARRYNLTAKELFVLFIVWSAPNGCLQTEICDRLSATRQTISAIVKKFWKMGYLSLTESETDRRNKIVRLTEAGKEYTDRIIAPPTEAEIDAMMELDDKDIIDLVRITTQFSQYMKEKFDAIKEC